MALTRRSRATKVTFACSIVQEDMSTDQIHVRPGVPTPGQLLLGQKHQTVQRVDNMYLGTLVK